MPCSGHIVSSALAGLAACQANVGPAPGARRYQHPLTGPPNASTHAINSTKSWSQGRLWGK